MKKNIQEKIRLKKIEVIWEDITFFSGTHSIEKLPKLKIELIKTCGYLIEENKNYLLVACSYSLMNERFMDIYKFPKRVILKKRILK